MLQQDWNVLYCSQQTRRMCDAPPGYEDGARHRRPIDIPRSRISHENTAITTISEEERLVCQEVVKKLKGTSQKVKRANILLKADKGWTDTRIAEALDCRSNTV